MAGKGLRAGAAALAVAATLGACSPIYRDHGFVPTDSDLAALTVGVDTRDSVVASVGRPTTTGVLDTSTLYYVQSRFQTLAFLAPREIEREVLAISFAPDGTLGNIERFGLEQGRVVALSRRTTDRIFADSAVIDQLLGNIGRFDAGTLLGEE